MPYLYNPTGDDYSISVGGPLPVCVPAGTSIEVSDEVAAEFADHTIFEVQADAAPVVPDPPAAPVADPDPVADTTPTA